MVGMYLIVPGKEALFKGWSWEINYRFRVPRVDVETGEHSSRPRGALGRCDKAQVVSRLQTKVDWLDTHK